MIYDYLTGKEKEPQSFVITNPYQDYYCEKCGKKGDIHAVGMDLTIFGYQYLCTDCANLSSEACMKSCPQHYGFKNSEEVHANYQHIG